MASETTASGYTEPMCGRFTLTEFTWLPGRFGLQLPMEEPPDPRYNVAPSQQIPVIVDEGDGPVLRWMEWGFQPGWFKVAPNRPPPINARAETLLDRPMFRDSVAKQRCLIPADGFYEWRKVPGQRVKQPVYARLKGGEPFAFAGLYTTRKDDTTGKPHPSCVIITTKPNEIMAPIHDRMPVILSREDEPRWLDHGTTDRAAIIDCLRSYPSERMEAFPVSSLVSSARNDGSSLIRPADE